MNLEPLGKIEHVEVLIDDLFVEHYDDPPALFVPPVVRRADERKSSLLGGLAALAGLVALALFFTAYRKRQLVK